MKFPEGTLLISDPFLKDPYFQRTVIMICDSNSQGHLGFVINKVFKTRDGIATIQGSDRFPAFYGGPVQPDTLHFIHTRPDIIGAGNLIADGIYWSGNYEEAVNAVTENLVTPQELKFFLGYSGWEASQLQNEYQEKTWLTDLATKKIVFHENPDEIWKMSLEEMGGEYKMMANFPIDPQLN